MWLNRNTSPWESWWNQVNSGPTDGVELVVNLSRRHCLGLAVAGLAGAAEDGDVVQRWKQIAAETDGVVGVAKLHLESGKGATLNGDDRFPMASVCKLPIAINILAMVGEGKLSLKDNIEIPLYDVVRGVSEVAERWPKQKIFPLDELLEWMVAKSDNSAVQRLFRMGGGAAGMATRFRQWKIDGMRVDRSEEQCNLDAAGVTNIPPVSDWKPGMLDELTAKIAPADRLRAMHRFLEDPRDTATPNGTVRLLAKAFRGELLSRDLTARLVEILKATSTGKGRIKGLLPAGTVVAHKTGTTATAAGLNGGTNDVGVIMLPKGAGRLIVAIYIKGSTRDLAAREMVIAKIARAAFDSHRAA
jgi:beta-lactamase class A